MEEYDYMDQDKFDAMMDTYLAKRAKLPWTNGQLRCGQQLMKPVS